MHPILSCQKLEKGRSLELVFGDHGMIVAIEDDVLREGQEIKLGSSGIGFVDAAAEIFWASLPLVTWG